MITALLIDCRSKAAKLIIPTFWASPNCKGKKTANLIAAADIVMMRVLPQIHK